MKKIIVLVAFLCVVFTVNAQTELNAYKYIIVKKQYGFQKSADAYQLNSLTKFLLMKNNLHVLFDRDNFPNDLAVNSCVALTVELVDESGMFNTELSANFRDCKNQIVYTTPVGMSKIKDYKQAYHAAIRKSFAVLKDYKYSYTGREVVVFEELKKEVSDLNGSHVVSDGYVVDVPEKVLPSVSKAIIEGDYSNGNMSFKVLLKGGGFELIHPEIGKIATLYKTSTATLFIVQWLGKTEPKLAEITADNSLKIDTDSGFKIYKKKQ